MREEVLPSGSFSSTLPFCGVVVNLPSVRQCMVIGTQRSTKSRYSVVSIAVRFSSKRARSDVVGAGWIMVPVGGGVGGGVGADIDCFVVCCQAACSRSFVCKTIDVPLVADSNRMCTLRKCV